MGQPLGNETGAARPAEESRARRILIYGDPTLRRVAAPVETIDGDVEGLVTALFETMDDAPGIGLAGPQVGALRRVFVVDPSRMDPAGRRLAMINPRILEFTGLTEYEEGCLSVPGIYADVRRPARILVRYHGLDQKEREEGFEGVMARVIQHEYDHLDGKLFVDHLSRMRRTLLMKRLREFEQRARDDG